MRSSLLVKLAYGFGANPYSTPFNENRFDWNNLFQQPAQQNSGGGGNGMGALGMLALPFLMGGFGDQQPQDNRTNGQRIMDAGKGAWDATKGAVQFAGENLTPSGMATGLYDTMANAPKTMSDGWNQAWNGKGMGDVGMGALQMALPTGVAGLAGYGAYKGLKNAPAITNALRTAPGNSFVGRGAGWVGSQLSKVPGLARLGGAGAGALGLGGTGVLSRGLGVAGLAGTGYNAFTREQNPDYGLWGNAGLEAANTLGAIGSGWQTAGPWGALAGAGTALAGNTYRLGKESLGLMDDWQQGREAEAGADMWQNRVNMQNKLKAQLGEEGWKKHVQTQRAAGKKSWEAPASPALPAQHGWRLGLHVLG